MPRALSIMNTGKRSDPNSPASRGSNQVITCRVTRSGAGKSGNSFLTHGPAVTIALAASIVRSWVTTRTPPQRIGAAQQWHIGGMLVIAEPDDAASAVGRAALVARPQALDGDDALSPASKLIGRRAAHRAEPDHDDVDRSHQLRASAWG